VIWNTIVQGCTYLGAVGTSVFFTGEILPEGEFFFTSGLSLAKFGSKKNIIVAKNLFILTIFHPFEPIFIHFQGFHPTSG
jgi:hypothetical protein